MSKLNGNKPSLFKEFEEYTTSKGVKLEVYPVPTQIINNMSTPYDKEKPKRPSIEMKTKGGIQNRWIKAGDPGWEEYQENLQEWEDKCDTFRDAVANVMALPNFHYPKDLEFRPMTQLLIDQGFVTIPTNEWEHKWKWLQDTAIGSHDEMEIGYILKKFSGIPEDIIEAQKERFRNILSGQVARPMGDGNGSESRESEEYSEIESESVLETN